MKIILEEEAFTSLRGILQHYPHERVRQKALVILLKSQGLENCKITKIAGISENTLRTYCCEYMKDGIAAIEELNFRKPESKLVPFRETIENYLKQTPPASAKQACEEIHALTGVRLEKTQMRNYLKLLGAKFRKVGGIPAKANVDQQEKFLKTELQPRLNEAEEGKRVVYFVDAAHFVLGAFLGFLWSIARIFVKTPCGRQRFNVLGALNAVTKELVMITNATYITSIQICDLLRLLAVKTNGPITVVLDNARYQRCAIVIALAKELGIELLFLPPYSPNLNLIERVWKLTKKQCLNSKYYSDFNLFKNAISNFLTSMHHAHATELKTLLTLKFQTFKA